MGKERYLEILIALNQCRKKPGQGTGGDEDKLIAELSALSFFLIPLPSFFTMSRMSSKLSGLLGLGSTNKLALCKCQSGRVSTPLSLPLPQKGSVCGCCHAQPWGSPRGVCLEPWCSQLEGTGLQSKPSLVLGKIPCLVVIIFIPSGREE